MNGNLTAKLLKAILKYIEVVKSTILIGRNYLVNYIVQSNYCIIKFFNSSFLRITLKQKFDKFIRENL